MNEPKRPYQLTFEERPAYLYARIKAETLEYEATRNYLQEVAIELERLGQDRLLIDRDCPHIMERGQLFFTAVNLAAILYRVKLAFANPYPELDEALDFAALTANNRGANFKVFRDVESAEKWLLGDQDRPRSAS